MIGLLAIVFVVFVVLVIVDIVVVGAQRSRTSCHLLLVVVTERS